MFKLKNYKKNVISNIFSDLSKVAFTALIISPFIKGGAIKLYLTGFVTFVIFVTVAIIFKEKENG